MFRERVPTGIDGLDMAIEGGFPRGSLILIGGNPGTGKTVFSACFTYKGAVEYGEKGVYVSFVESRETFFSIMKRFGFDFERLEKEGKFKFLSMIPVKAKGASAILRMILEEVDRLQAERLVIDSFSAMSQAIREPIDIRILLNTVLSRIVRKSGCTTLLIVEAPFGSEEVGLGIEEFVSDGVIMLKRREFEDKLLRELTILKLRETEIAHPKLAFTLKDGFEVFPPVTLLGFGEPIARYEVIPHGENYFSSGVRDLDEILKVMIRRSPRSYYSLLEVEKDVALPLEYPTFPVISNFLNQGHGVIIIPPQGITAQTVKKRLEPHVSQDLIQRNLRVVSFRVAGEAKPSEDFIIPLDGKSITEDFVTFWRVGTELRRKTGKPLLSIVGYDTVEYIYGEKEALKVLGEDVARVRNYGDARINIIRPTVYIADQLRALADIHLKVEQIDGALFVHGIKPETPLLNVQLVTEKGTSKLRFVPIV
ncbi:MAG TPA: hypothetical protein ENF42_03395 [Candidatus Bathyarchaeota archaeon]|nr:hypothetical protein [Candidatus Bathyarchaeota archaeon]